MSHYRRAAIAAVVLIAGTISASAAPAGSLAGAGEALRAEARVGGAEAVKYECWWSPYRGKVCTWVRPRVHGFYGYHVRPRHHWRAYPDWRGYRDVWRFHSRDRRHW